MKGWEGDSLVISRGRVGSIIREDLVLRKLSAMWVNGASRLSKFWNFFDAIQMISSRDLWPWTIPGYTTVTRRQSINQWSGSIAAHRTPKHSERKNPVRKFSPRFFGIKTASSSLIIFQRATLSTRIITVGAIEGHFEGKTPREGHQGGLVLARQCPALLGTCNPEETGLPGFPVSWSPTLFSGSGPVGLPTVPWTEKAIERSQFFVRLGGHCCSGDLVGRTAFWLFFWVACKS